jgi:soluble lytic murein transglycosylase
MRRFAPRRFAAALALALVLAYAGLVGLRVFYPIAYTEQIVALSEARDLDPSLVAAMVRCESRFRADVVSPRGAIGLMQIMPETGAWIAEQIGIPEFDVDHLTEPEINLRLGTWYLHSLLDRFGARDDALAAYNAGPTHAERWAIDERAMFRETRVFVNRVNASLPVYRFYFSAPWILRITPSLLL